LGSAGGCSLAGGWGPPAHILLPTFILRSFAPERRVIYHEHHTLHSMQP
jgi:hypothetical protein